MKFECPLYTTEEVPRNETLNFDRLILKDVKIPLESINASTKSYPVQPRIAQRFIFSELTRLAQISFVYSSEEYNIKISSCSLCKYLEIDDIFSNVQKYSDTATTLPIVKEKEIKTESPPSSEGLKMKMFVNRNIGQICDSWTQVSRIASELSKYFVGINPTYSLYFQDLMIDKIIGQAKTQCALQKRSSFPLAAVVLLLIAQIRGFEARLLEKMILICPYIDLTHNGTVSFNEDKLEPISGVIHLLGSIVAYSSLPFAKSVTIFDISYGWKFLANILNKPVSYATSSVVFAFLEVCSYSMWLKYGLNFKRLLITIKKDLAPKLPISSHSANQTMLLLVEELLEDLIGEPDGFKIDQ
mgnify:CR=1 FL=1